MFRKICQVLHTSVEEADTPAVAGSHSQSS